MFLGLIIVALVASIGATGLLNVPSVYADANCDKADREDNTQGNRRGNAKQCSFAPSDGPKEPVRKCGSPNEFKDNDDDGSAVCRIQGRN